MRKIILGVVALLVLGGGILAYSRLGGSPEVKRERALKKAKEYMAQAKVNEAIIEYKNASEAPIPVRQKRTTSLVWLCSDKAMRERAIKNWCARRT